MQASFSNSDMTCMLQTCPSTSIDTFLGSAVSPAVKDCAGIVRPVPSAFKHASLRVQQRKNSRRASSSPDLASSSHSSFVKLCCARDSKSAIALITSTSTPIALYSSRGATAITATFSLWLKLKTQSRLNTSSGLPCVPDAKTISAGCWPRKSDKPTRNETCAAM